MDMDGSSRRDWIVAAIGVFKLIKAAVLAPLGVAALGSMPETIVRSATHVLGWTGAFLGHHVVRAALARVLAMKEHTLRGIGAISLCYAAVFLVEGVGLLYRQRWAEWMTVIVTASFVPFEIYELSQRPGIGKVVAIALNVAIVVYLVWRRVREHGSRTSRFRTA
jgi:uncharacterized membrane protein (DUF2068 family)